LCIVKLICQTKIGVDQINYSVPVAVPVEVLVETNCLHMGKFGCTIGSSGQSPGLTVSDRIIVGWTMKRNKNVHDEQNTAAGTAGNDTTTKWLIT